MLGVLWPFILLEVYIVLGKCLKLISAKVNNVSPSSKNDDTQLQFHSSLAKHISHRAKQNNGPRAGKTKLDIDVQSYNNIRIHKDRKRKRQSSQMQKKKEKGKSIWTVALQTTYDFKWNEKKNKQTNRTTESASVSGQMQFSSCPLTKCSSYFQKMSSLFLSLANARSRF